MTEAIVASYSQNFREGAVLWRATDRPGDGLNFRFYERRPVEVIRIAEDAKLLGPDHPLTLLLDAWALPWGEGHSMIPEQSCDFDAEKGLVKSWVYMGGLRPLDDILSLGNVPASIIQHRDIFHHRGLHLLRHVAVDFGLGTVNFYFRVEGPLSEPRAKDLVELAGYRLFTTSDFEDMQKFLSDESFTFAVTIEVVTAQTKRVAFYALGLDPKSLPEVGHRLWTFFAEAPSYDAEEFTAVAWSFGVGNKKYVKAEKSYCGGVIPLLRNWKSNGFHR